MGGPLDGPEMDGNKFRYLRINGNKSWFNAANSDLQFLEDNWTLIHQQTIYELCGGFDLKKYLLSIKRTEWKI